MGRFRNAWNALTGSVGHAGPIVPREETATIPKGMQINDTAVQEARITGRQVMNPWQIPQAAPFARKAADGTQPQIAMDGALVPAGGGINSIYQWAMGGSFSEGLGFLGYAYLAELTQRPEYRRVSEIFAAECTRKWIKLKGDEKRINLIQERLDALDVRGIFRRVTELDGFFGRGQIFVDLGDDINTPEGQAELQAELVPAAKLDGGKGRGKLKGLRVIEPFWCYPGMYESSNPLDGEFYKPTTWYVMATEVHHTRLLTVIGREMPDILKPAYSFGGLSLSQMVKPYVDNWLRTRQSISDLLHSFSTMVLKTDMSQILQGGAAAMLIKRLTLFNQTRDNRGVMAVGMDEELSNVTTPLSTIDALLAQSQEQIASAAGIPLVVLLGVTPSGLNASSDGEVRTFYDNVNSYQERVYRSPLETILDLIQLDIDGTIDPEIKVQFIPLWEMNETEKAAIRKSDADVDAAYVDRGVVSNEEVRKRITEDESSPYFGMKLVGNDPDDDDDDDEEGSTGNPADNEDDDE